MADSLVHSIVNALQNNVSHELIVFIISLCPVLELRGGLIAAKLFNMGLIKAFIICYVGNMLPIPFILLFIKKIFECMKKSEKLGKVVKKMEQKAEKNSDKVRRYKMWGLLVLVAIPLPGTGGWTGALVAALMDLKIKNSLPVIAAGVFIAGIIVSIIMYGLVGAFAK